MKEAPHEAGAKIRFAALLLAATAAVVWAWGPAWGIGFILGETKDELKLKYDVSVQDHGTRRVTAVFALEDGSAMRSAG